MGVDDETVQGGAREEGELAGVAVGDEERVGAQDLADQPSSSRRIWRASGLLGRSRVVPWGRVVPRDVP